MISTPNCTRCDIIRVSYGDEISLSMSCPLAELPLGALPRVLLAEISEMCCILRCVRCLESVWEEISGCLTKDQIGDKMEISQDVQNIYRELIFDETSYGILVGYEISPLYIL